MKLFVSGKIGAQIDAAELMREFVRRGHEITFDWTSIPHLRPYEDNEAASAEAAVLEARGVEAADALVVVVHERGVGMFVELGVALALQKPVVALTSGTPRSMFLFHPLVTRVETVEGVFKAVDSLLPPLERPRIEQTRIRPLR